MRTTTTNGAGAYGTTGNDNLNLFFNVGASRNNLSGIKNDFKKAFLSDPLTATAILLYARDIRHAGCGERNVFRTLLKDLIGANRTIAAKVISLIPEVGRFDDLKVAYGTTLEVNAISIWRTALNQKNVLAAKWADRSDRLLQKALSLNEAGLRKLLSSIRKEFIPEAKMCAKQWSSIEYDKIPSVCGMRNSKAFSRNDAERYVAFLGNKETKVNASCSYPHDVYMMVKAGQAEAADKYWQNLPQLDIVGNMLPIIDTSSSMNAIATASLSCLDLSISIGTFVSQQIKGTFHNMAMTFDDTPELVEIPTGPIDYVFRTVRNMNWGGSTNIEATYTVLLEQALKRNAPEKDMPEYLLILSDMQFNECEGGYWRAKESVAPETVYENMRKKYAAAGYKSPKVIFWNLNASHGTYPVCDMNGETALIGGFNPAILKACLSVKNFTPLDVMEEALAPFKEMLK